MTGAFLRRLDFVKIDVEGGELVPDRSRPNDREMHTLVFTPRRNGVAG